MNNLRKPKLRKATIKPGHALGVIYHWLEFTNSETVEEAFVKYPILEQAFAQLEPHLAQPFKMRYFDGMTLSAIASIYGYSVNNAARYIRRAGWRITRIAGITMARKRL